MFAHLTYQRSRFKSPACKNFPYRKRRKPKTSLNWLFTATGHLVLREGPAYGNLMDWVLEGRGKKELGPIIDKEGLGPFKQRGRPEPVHPFSDPVDH